MDRFWSSAGIVAPIDPSSEQGLLSGVGREFEDASVSCPGQAALLGCSGERPQPVHSIGIGACWTVGPWLHAPSSSVDGRIRRAAVNPADRVIERGAVADLPL